MHIPPAPPDGTPDPTASGTPPDAAPAPAPILSPDGKQWWDGTFWREVAAPAAGAPVPPPAWPALPSWQTPPPPRSQAGLRVASLVVVTALAGAGIVAAIFAATHRGGSAAPTGSSTASGAGTSTGSTGSSIYNAPAGSTHCTYRVSYGTFSLVTDAVNAPTDCSVVQDAFSAAEESVGATVTPINGVPSGATPVCSHEFGTSGYAMTIYRTGDDALDQGFVRAACAAFTDAAGG